MATWPVNSSAGTRSTQNLLYAEARIQTLLLTRIVNLLSQLVGPAVYTVGGTSFQPEDVSADVENWRTDPGIIA